MRDDYENGRHHQRRNLPNIIIYLWQGMTRNMTRAHLQKMDEAKLFTYHQFHLGKGTILLQNKLLIKSIVQEIRTKTWVQEI